MSDRKTIEVWSRSSKIQIEPKKTNEKYIVIKTVKLFCSRRAVPISHSINLHWTCLTKRAKPRLRSRSPTSRKRCVGLSSSHKVLRVNGWTKMCSHPVKIAVITTHSIKKTMRLKRKAATLARQPNKLARINERAEMADIICRTHQIIKLILRGRPWSKTSCSYLVASMASKDRKNKNYRNRILALKKIAIFQIRYKTRWRISKLLDRLAPWLSVDSYSLAMVSPWTQVCPYSVMDCELEEGMAQMRVPRSLLINHLSAIQIRLNIIKTKMSTLAH